MLVVAPSKEVDDDCTDARHPLRAHRACGP